MSDSATAVADTSTAAATTATASSSSATTDTSTTSAPTTQAPSTASPATTQGTSAGEATTPSSLPSDTRTHQTTTTQPGQQQQPVNWQARYTELQKLSGRQTNELHQLREFRKGLGQDFDPRAYAEYRKAQAEAKTRELPGWHAKNPDRPMALAAIERVKAFEAARAGLDDAGQRALIDRLGVSTDDVQLFKKFQASQQRLQADFHADPEGFLESRFERMFEERFEQRMQERESQMMGQQKFQRDMAELERTGATKQYGDDIRDLVQGLREGRHSQWDLIRALAATRHQLDQVRARVGSADEAAKAAEAKEALLKGKAAGTRDPVAAPVVDVRKRARELAHKDGVPTDSPRFMDYLDRAQKEAEASG